jgi:hypothetical protein
VAEIRRQRREASLDVGFRAMPGGEGRRSKGVAKIVKARAGPRVAEPGLLDQVAERVLDVDVIEASPGKGDEEARGLGTTSIEPISPLGIRLECAPGGRLNWDLT